MSHIIQVRHNPITAYVHGSTEIFKESTEIFKESSEIFTLDYV